MGYTIVNILGALLIVSSLLVVLLHGLRRTAIIYGIQAFILVCIFLTLGFTTGSTELFTWAGTAFITKVILVPGVMLFAYSRLLKLGKPPEEPPASIRPMTAIILAAVELLICFAAVWGINLPTAEVVRPALAISLAHFFIGLTCIVSQRNIFKQIFGYCLMENGSHLTLALLAPTAPELVEIGVATDAIFAVVIMAFLAYHIYKTTKSLDSDDLKELKG